MPHTGQTVHNATDVTITGNHNLTDYEDCRIAYIDQNKDGKLSADDTVWIYKDYDDDSVNEIGARFTFKILDGSGEMVLRKTL
jgi:hypothetical protein